MAKGAKAKVRLDTKSAERKLRDIGKQGKAAAGRVQQKANEGGGVGFGGGFGLGAAAAVGVGAAKRAAGSMFGSVGDIIGEKTAGLRSIGDAALGGPEARGRKQAREETADAWAEIAARTGDGNSPAIRAYHKNISDMRVKTEQGRNKVEQILTHGGSTIDSEDPFDKILDAIVGAIQDGFLNLITRLTGFGGK